MDQRTIGSSALAVSLAGLGCNNFGIRSDPRTSVAVIQAALDCGITHFDTAHNYGYGNSEELLGAAVAGRRDQVVIATKFGGEAETDPAFQGSSRRSIFNSCEDSLRRLGTDYIDLYYQHLPDPGTPIDETFEALDDLVAQGKVRFAGCSHYDGAGIDAAMSAARARSRRGFVASQSEWNLLHRQIEADLVPACRRHGLGVIPYFPLASGMLSGKYRAGAPFPEGSRLAGSAFFQREVTPAAYALVERLRALAERSGRTPVELALGWLAAKEDVASVIVGATTPAQVTENTRAILVGLSPAEVAELDELSAPGQAHGAEDRDAV